MTDSDERTFVLVLRGPASAIFWPNDSFHVTRWGTPHGSVEMLFRSRYQEVIKGSPNVPTDLWVEMRVVAPDLNSAIQWFGPQASGMLTVMSFLANARIGPIGLDIAYETTPGKKSHEFFQRFYPAAKIRSISSRRLVPADVALICEKMKGHPSQMETLSAIGRYADALVYWGLGGETLVAWFLYVGIETLTIPHMKWYMAKHGATQANLIAQFVPPKTPKEEVQRALRNGYRRQTIFKGDADCYANLQKARHELSHGVTNMFALRERAADAQHRAMGYLRDAIFDVLDAPDDFRAKYTSEPYDKPRGDLSVEKYLRATLTSEADELAQEDQLYPFFAWNSGISKIEVSEDGLIGVSPTDTITARFGKGVTASNISVEYWDASLAPDKNIPMSGDSAAASSKI